MAELLAVIGRLQEKKTTIERQINERKQMSKNKSVPKRLEKEVAILSDCTVTTEMALRIVDSNTISSLKECVT